MSLEFESHFAEQAAALRRGTLSIVPENGLEQKLAKSAKTGKPLRVKLGLDPTAPDIHLGFAVVLRKLRQFQDLGHQVVVIIGDYTALIGDPSGRSKTRPMLTDEEIQQNGATYVAQLSKILDPEKMEVRFNSEWLGKLRFADVVRLATHMTVAQVMERDDFSKRWAEHKPISLHELLYPLAQAYDSVCIEADIEMGGQDQTFNIMAGRTLQHALEQEEQVALYMPLLLGLDGVNKMSKSLKNYVGVSEDPDMMFGKLLSMPDELMEMYFHLCTDLEKDEIESLLSGIANETLNPKDVKRRLAREIIAIYHGATAAAAADEEFERIHKRKEIPPELKEVALTQDLLKDGKFWICRAVVAAGFATGTSDARRKADQGGVKLNGEKVTSSAQFEPFELDGAVLQVGPLNFARLVVCGH